MPRPITEEEEQRIHAAVTELNLALEAFTNAGYRDVGVEVADITAVGQKGRRLLVSVHASIEEDVVSIAEHKF